MTRIEAGYFWGFLIGGVTYTMLIHYGKNLWFDLGIVICCYIGGYYLVRLGEFVLGRIKKQYEL